MPEFELLNLTLPKITRRHFYLRYSSDGNGNPLGRVNQFRINEQGHHFEGKLLDLLDAWKDNTSASADDRWWRMTNAGDDHGLIGTTSDNFEKHFAAKQMTRTDPFDKSSQ